MAGLGLLLVLAAVAVFADAVAPHDPFRPVGPPLQRPSAAHWLGTDNL